MNETESRQCGACTACCHGCTIYERRPKVCRDWMCMWREFPSLFDESWRPDRSGVLMRMAEVDASDIRVPYFEVLDATHKKVLDGAHSGAAYWVGKNKASALFGVAPGGPFGMDLRVRQSGQDLLSQIRALLGREFHGAHEAGDLGAHALVEGLVVAQVERLAERVADRIVRPRC